MATSSQGLHHGGICSSELSCTCREGCLSPYTSSATPLYRTWTGRQPKSCFVLRRHASLPQHHLVCHLHLFSSQFWSSLIGTQTRLRCTRLKAVASQGSTRCDGAEPYLLVHLHSMMAGLCTSEQGARKAVEDHRRLCAPACGSPQDWKGSVMAYL